MHALYPPLTYRMYGMVWCVRPDNEGSTPTARCSDLFTNTDMTYPQERLRTRRSTYRVHVKVAVVVVVAVAVAVVVAVAVAVAVVVAVAVAVVVAVALRVAGGVSGSFLISQDQDHFLFLMIRIISQGHFSGLGFGLGLWLRSLFRVSGEC